MKQLISLLCLALAVTVGSGTALAENIKGRLGVTGKIGFYNPGDSDFDNFKLETDVGFLGGGGLIFGVTDNLAAEIDVTHTEFGTELVSGQDQGDFSVTNIALGVQYRFDTPQPKLSPYAGGGIDILINDYDRPGGADVDPTVGVHLCGGLDYFVTKHIVLNAEIRGVAAPEADIDAPGGASGHFDPSGVAGTFGVRFFFN
jgi:outer membrane protein